MADDLDPAAVERALEPALRAAGVVPRSPQGQRIIRAALAAARAGEVAAPTVDPLDPLAVMQAPVRLGRPRG